MVRKPVKECVDGQGRRRGRRKLDIEIAVSATALSRHVDHVALLAGNGDFRSLLAGLQREGVRVSVVSAIRSQPPMIADELRLRSDSFIKLDEMRDVIGRMSPA